MKSRSSGVVLLVCLLTLGACSSGEVPLAYHFDKGDGTRYRWTIDSSTSVSSTTEESVTTMNMVVDVHEQVAENSDGDSILTMTLTPVSIRQGNSPVRNPGPMTVKYEMGANGEIARPVTEDLPGPAASALQLGATLARSRIALPDEPVGIGDQWDTPLVLDGDLGNIKLDGKGRLVGFELKGKRKLARIETQRQGSIITQQHQGGVPVRLRGTSTSDARSSLDIDNGVLYSSDAHFVSDFDIASVESGKLIGSMRVVLNSTLQLLPDQQEAVRVQRSPAERSPAARRTPASRRSPGRG